MARKARVRAESGVYYVRLDSFAPLFLHESDNLTVKDLLFYEKENDFIEVYAFCFIENCIHIVLKEGLSGISGNIMRIKSKFAAYYNSKYNKSGALFKGRFYSLPLEDGSAVLKAVRFVHRIPLEFGLKMDFKGSSYPLYLKRDELISAQSVVPLIGTYIDFEVYNESGGAADKKQLPDEELIAKIREMFKEVSAEELESLSESQHRLLLKRIKQIEGATIDAIARVLGLEREEVEKA